MKYLLINITRFGDMLQTQPLLHALKVQGHSIAFVCLQNFEEAAFLLEDIDKVFALPASKILAFMPENWQEAFDTFEDFTQEIHSVFSPDCIINLTATLTARLLAKKLAFQEKEKSLPVRGFSLDEYGFGVNTNMWAIYMQAVTLNRVSSPFNLSDGFTLMADMELTAPEATNSHIKSASSAQKEQIKVLLNSLAIEGKPLAFIDKNKTQYIALQLGASVEKRQWDTAYFAELSRYIYAIGYIPVLVGTKEEARIADVFYAEQGIAKNAMGKTSIPMLSALLQECKAIVTNDTGTMHLAAAVGLPVLALFLATAQPWDTGPVSEDACLLEPKLDCHPCGFHTPCQKNFECRRLIPAKLVFSLLQKRLETGKWQQEISNSTRIWTSYRDNNSFLNLKNLGTGVTDSRMAFFTMQRSIYKQLIDILQKKKKVEDIEVLSYSYVDSFKKEELITILTQLQELSLLLEQQAKLIFNVPKMRSSFLATGQKIITLLNTSSCLVPLAFMWQQGMEEYGNDLTKYLEFSQSIQKVMKAWLQGFLQDT